MIGGVRQRFLAAVVLSGLALTACATGAATDPTTPPTTTGPTVTTTPTPTPSTSPSTSPSITPVTASTPVPTKTTTARPTTTTTPLPSDYCTAAQLTMRILPGGAEPNYEIAAVTFTNTSSRSCSLSGFPAVQLRRGGAALATATPRAGQVARLVHLAPGVQAEAQIRDHITCQAPLSDSVHAVAPAPLTTLRLDRPNFQMRGCTVTIDPIVLSS